VQTQVDLLLRWAEYNVHFISETARRIIATKLSWGKAVMEGMALLVYRACA
jgi:hypothetical protein